MRMPSPGHAALVLALAFAALTVSIGSTAATFGAQAESPGNAVTAAPDFRGPTVTASTVGKAQGGTTGFVKKGGSYFLYANVSDSGNPASGIAGVTADLSGLTAGAGSVTLNAGSFTAGGQSYNYRSSQQTAGASLAEGTVAYSIATLDNASNSGSGGGSVTVDNTAPATIDVQATNGGGTAGKAESGDTVVLTYSEPVEPESILTGWSGTPTGVVVRITTGVALIGGLLGQNEGLQVFDSTNSALLPLGALDLKQQYVAKTGLILPGTMTFGATGTASTMSISAAGVVTIVLGTHAGNNALTVTSAGAMAWAPAASPFDRAANAVSTASATESGAADVEF